MNKWSLNALLIAAGMAMQCYALPALAADANAKPGDLNRQLKVGLVNFKLCVEESKLGKQEQASFDALKKQMENVVEEKETVLNDLANKLNDPDQLDLMSADAETEMKRKFRALGQELQQLQQQYYQTLQQANFKVVQKISETVTKASEKVAKDKKLDLILNDETCFFASGDLDVSKDVVKEMDVIFDQEAKQNPTATAPKI